MHSRALITNAAAAAGDSQPGLRIAIRLLVDVPPAGSPLPAGPSGITLAPWRAPCGLHGMVCITSALVPVRVLERAFSPTHYHRASFTHRAPAPHCYAFVPFFTPPRLASCSPRRFAVDLPQRSSPPLSSVVILVLFLYARRQAGGLSGLAVNNVFLYSSRTSCSRHSFSCWFFAPHSLTLCKGYMTRHFPAALRCVWC